MSGKGDDRRPLSVDEKEFAANWERIFGEKIDAALADVTDGARLGANSGSNPANVGSIPTAPAIYWDEPGEFSAKAWDKIKPTEVWRTRAEPEAIYINADTGE